MTATWLRWGAALTLGLLVCTQSTSAAGVKVPGGTTIEQVDFERHVMGVLGRFGCASGSCHGSFQGKGGMQLSLFGYEPAIDHQNLVRSGNGRRVSPADPDASLMLLKATGQVPHEGRTRFGKQSWAYDLVRAWIEQGAKHKPGSGEVKSVRVVPGEFAFEAAGKKGQLKVEAIFADDSKEDITAFCDFRINDDTILSAIGNGAFESRQPGDTAVIVSYRGSVVPVRVMVPAPNPRLGFTYPSVPTVNYIDREVFAKLKRLNMVPSELCSDSEFIRRIYLDTIGGLPTPDEVKKFLADKSADKREKKIDELLKHPMHASLWATKFCDITGNNTDSLEQPVQRRTYVSQMWHDWFRKRVQDNTPYDDIVKGILTATSREGKTPEDYIKEVDAVETAQDKGEKTKYADRATLDLFWRKQVAVTTSEWGEKTAAAFLGVRLECAQCHKHPFDRWTQADYRAYANIFAPVAFAISPDSQKAFRDATPERSKKSQQAANMARQKGQKITSMPIGQLREVFVARVPQGGRGGPGRLLTHPDTGKVLAPQTLGGPEIAVKSGDDPREALWKWLATEKNPFFARSFVNRIWGHYFGVGIVHPVDDFSLANPPSNEKLLDALAADFAKSKFDIRAIEKSILMSRTYQLSSTPNDTNKFDKINYARSYVRPMMAEVVVDMLNDALGTSEKWLPGEAPANSRTIEVGASRVQNQNVNYVLRVFGRPARTSACDCERTLDPALPQKLFLMADVNLQTKLRATDNRLAALLKQESDDDKALENLFLATLSRSPTEKERLWFADYKKKKGSDRRALFTDTLWALINTTEFIFNH